MTNRRLLRLVPLALVLASFGLDWAGPVRAQISSAVAGATKPKRKKTTQAERKAAAARAAAARQAPTASALTATAAPVAGQTPDYFGIYPNYANSQFPILTDATNCPGGANYPERAYQCGIRKFVDALPSLTMAVAEACSYSGQAADCYEIHLRQYTQKLHTDLPATTLRGYVQVDSVTGRDVAAISYLGPVIVATSGKPVRVKFVNELPIGTGPNSGDLFIPTDTTYMGAGAGPIAGESYTQNRATLHLHGGATPWISDGTPHQWTTPATETTPYPNGVSVHNVPDMDNGSEPQGTLTFFYSNQQSARLMFYHDHAYGITRLNVYVGEAAGYLLTDSVEQGLISGGTLPGVGTPLVIQDRTFVPDNTLPFTNLVGTFGSQLEAQDPTWDVLKWGGPGSLWFPHVYMPNQNPADLEGANAFGRWDYGPWFWPPFTGLTYGPLPNPYLATEPNAPEIPGTPNPSGVPEGFMDTPLVNGMAYPVLNVPAGQVRFRILNAANDRFFNLSLFVADPAVTTLDGRSNTEVRMVPFNSTQNATAPFPTWWYDSSVPNPFDDRVGGVPDPATRGPAMIQIGSEGGFLPGPALILNQPVNYVMNKRDITVGNVKEKALFLAPAERADVVVDFTHFAGKTLILYNDAPAPVPAADARLDYFTGDLDQTDTGGAPSTLPGFGPNTRTIMQIVVGGSGGTAPVDDYNAGTLSALKAALPTAFAASQDTIIVPQAPYNAVYGGNFPSGASAYVKIQDTSFSFAPIASTAPTLTLGPTVTAPLQPKSIIENFTMDYGRMNALLGVEIPNTNIINQTSIPQGYIDPPTEVLKASNGAFVATNVSTLADGTQLWKITHNGVDTHAMHFHMFNVQIVNRVGWDGAIRPPDANELGWKDTIRTNPLEDIVVALRPVRLTNVPFKLPNSVRPLDVTQPLGSTLGFTNVDPAGNPVTVTNELTNFGWEYVWHCHLLGHEENDMMRGMAVAVPPETPSNLAAALQGSGNNKRAVLTWVNNALNATSLTVQRATDSSFTLPVTLATLGVVTTYTDPIGNTSQTYYYRVFASDTVGSTVAGYPQMTADSAFSNTAGVNLPVPPAAPTNLAATLIAGPQVRLNWTDNANNESAFVVERCQNAGCSNFAQLGGNLAANTTTYTDAAVVQNTTYRYRVQAVNAAGSSAYAGPVTIVVNGIPLAPSNVRATAARATGGNDRVTVTWLDNANNETGFTIQRATNSGFTAGLVTSTVGANVTTFTTGNVARFTSYYFRVRATNAVGASAWVNATPFPVLTPYSPRALPLYERDAWGGRRRRPRRPRTRRRLSFVRRWRGGGVAPSWAPIVRMMNIECPDDGAHDPERSWRKDMQTRVPFCLRAARRRRPRSEHPW